MRRIEKHLWFRRLIPTSLGKAAEWEIKREEKGITDRITGGRYT